MDNGMDGSAADHQSPALNRPGAESTAGKGFTGLFCFWEIWYHKRVMAERSSLPGLKFLFLCLEVTASGKQ